MRSDTSPPDTPSPNHREIFAMLCTELPPPPDDTPAARVARDRGAMAAVAALHPAAMERAGYWFRETSAPEAAPSREPAAARSADAEPVPTQADIDAEAAFYAVIYPDRAARIRAEGGLPARLDFGPPEPQIVAALLRGATVSGQAPRADAAQPA